jgi:uncharacterized protein YejL (UPF0352 family)
MIKIVNAPPTEAAEAKSLQYYFDGEDWCQKWETKLDASLVVMGNHFQTMEELRQQVLNGEVSPLAYHICANSFSISMLSSYTGLSKRRIRKHLEPKNFNQLNEEILKKYSTAFEILVEELKKV